MTEKSIFWSAPTSGDGTAAYTEDEIRSLFGVLTQSLRNASRGIFEPSGGALEVTGATSPLAVADGYAFVNGYFYWSTASENVAVSTPVVGTTGHRVVLRLVNASKTIRIVLISSADGTASYPALTQSDGTQWEIPLANLTITTGGAITLSDARDYVRLNTKIATWMIENGAVTFEKIPDGEITGAKIGNGEIDTTQLANNAVDDTKAGNRVPMLTRREGGNSGDWSLGGTTDYTPTAVKIQAGVSNWSGGSSTTGTKAVTFPQAFSNKPIIFLTVVDSSSGVGFKIRVRDGTIAASGFTWEWEADSAQTTVIMNWLAIGPE